MTDTVHCTLEPCDLEPIPCPSGHDHDHAASDLWCDACDRRIPDGMDVSSNDELTVCARCF